MSGIRTFKSLFAAVAAYHWAQGCDLSYLGPGEIPRVSVVSIKKDLADVVYQHISGRIQESPLFRETLLDKPTSESLLVRHHTGRPVEIKVVAGSRAGASLVARWSAGCVFDEFARMQGEGDAVVNWDHEREAVLYRLLRGAQIVHISSPWAPFGPAYNLVTEHWQKPTRDLVVVRAPAYELNPTHWTPERVEAARANPNVFKTDVMGEFATQEESMYQAESVTNAIRKTPGDLPFEVGCTYAAAMDPATRGNGWSLLVTTRKGNKKIGVLAREWIGSSDEPLKPREVMHEIAEVLRPYNIGGVESDKYYADALVDLGREVGLRVIPITLPEKEQTRRYIALGIRFDNGEIELPQNEHLRADLMRIRKRVTVNGVKEVLPHTSDGRHCDFAPVVMLGFSRYLAEYAPEKPSRMGAEEARVLAEMKKRYGRKEPDKGTPWA